MSENEKTVGNFIRTIVEEDLASGKHARVVTRFPPEPNGYLHIGHAKAIVINFGMAEDHPPGVCHLRFDDTNPEKEGTEFVEAIQRDVQWLGYDWGENLYFASDYFERFYAAACELIEKGLAYVDHQTAEEIRANRGTMTEPGVNSPYRDRTPEENLDLFARMRAGEFEEGTCILRAKIDMASGNFNLRDPSLYRIRKASHHRTGDDWCIYPMYDFAHPLEDAFEEITHSLCSLEFQDHRPLYDWVVANVSTPAIPRQIEFARLNLAYTVMSKRKLRVLVEDGVVDGWDDPRMPTLSGMRRRGYPAAAVRDFCERIGVAKAVSTVDMGMLEACVRENLNRQAERRLAVLRPIELVVENWPEGQVEYLEAVNNPENPSAGTRQIPFSGRLWIEQDDFRAEAPRKYFRLTPGREVRLRWAYFVTCTGFDTDPDTGAVVRVRCTYDPATRGGDAPDGRKVKGTIHWVSADHAVAAPVSLFDRLFADEAPEQGEWRENLNANSLEVLPDCQLEASVAEIPEGQTVQFERNGYFVKASGIGWLRTVGLRDSWAKVAGRK
ncbi:MAG: glutamine--tRNA ligase/YqeY domain fusion protein [Candidatus Binatia bacterium]|nr:glutamine--tRNA ligase/YqeY domain fusion protein [Candidatus Binatia bacterium]MDG2011730.1 glutamine--tRNA ligase/YqeY domain fusion protein [Candidatus Binatia bacterium]